MLKDVLKPIRLLRYCRDREGMMLRCEVYVYDDSVYIVGDELEIGIEFGKDMEAQAHRMLTEKGYVLNTATKQD